MAKGQYAGLYKSPGHFEDPEDYMNMADSMDYFMTFGAAPESVIEANRMARQKSVPNEPEATNPELDAFGNIINQDGRAKNLELLGGSSPNTVAPAVSTKVNNPTYGFMKLAEMAKAGKLAPQTAEEQPEIKPDMHTNEAFAYYTNLRENLKKKIDELKAEIAFRDKVKKIKARMDPLWKAARIQAIFTGDMTPLKNIMDRYDQLEKAERDEAYRDKALQQTADLAKMNKELENTSQAERNMQDYEIKKEIYQYAKSKLDKLPANDPARSELEDQVKNAEIQLKYAARKANMSNEYTELIKPSASEAALKASRLTTFLRANKVNNTEKLKELYDSMDDAQKQNLIISAHDLGLTDDDIGLGGESSKSDIKQEQVNKLNAKRTAFKNKWSKKSFIGQMNILTGKPIDAQAEADFYKEAKANGWPNATIKASGEILWQ